MREWRNLRWKVGSEEWEPSMKQQGPHGIEIEKHVSEVKAHDSGTNTTEYRLPESEEQDQNALQETAAHTYSWTPHVYHPERTTAQQSLRIKAVQKMKLPPSHSHDLQFSLHEVHCNVRQSVPQPPASLKLSNYMFDSAWSCSFPVTIKTLLVC